MNPLRPEITGKIVRDTYLRRRRKRRLSVAMIALPVVADQTILFGAKTLAGDGGAAPVNTGAPITSASIDSGDPSSHFAIAADGTITLTAAGDTANLSGAPYTLGCTFNGSVSATITIEAEPNAAHVGSDADVTAFYAQTLANMQDTMLLPRAGYALQAMQFNFTDICYRMNEEGSAFDTAFGSGTAWSFYADVYFYKDGTNHACIVHGRTNPVIAVRFQSSGELQVNNGAAWLTGTTAYSTGRHRIVVTYDGTTLKAWVKPVGGSETQEINTTTSYTTDGGEDTPYFGGFKASGSNITMNTPWRGLVYDAALWNADIGTTAKDDLIDGGDPDSYTSGLYWHPDTATGLDLSPTEKATQWRSEDDLIAGQAIYDDADTTSGAKPGNFVILHNPDTGEPVQYASSYWAAVQENDTNTLITLATSTDLINWTYNSTVFTGTGSDISLSDFVYMGHISGGHDPFWMFVNNDTGAGGEFWEVNLHTSSNMSTWNTDGSNPVFDTDHASGGKGTEDFRIVRLPDNTWLAFYEVEALVSGTSTVGIATHSSAVPSGKWTNADSTFFDEEPGYPGGTGDFIANPCVIRRGSRLYVFYEGAGFGSSGAVVTSLLRIHDGTGSYTTLGNWSRRGAVTLMNSYFFPNSVIMDGNDMYVYGNHGVNSTAFQIERQLYDPRRMFANPATWRPADT